MVLVVSGSPALRIRLDPWHSAFISMMEGLVTSQGTPKPGGIWEDEVYWVQAPPDGVGVGLAPPPFEHPELRFLHIHRRQYHKRHQRDDYFHQNHKELQEERCRRLWLGRRIRGGSPQRRG